MCSNTLNLCFRAHNYGESVGIILKVLIVKHLTLLFLSNTKNNQARNTRQ